MQAATFPPQSIERMMHVAAFAVSAYSGTNNRTLKPFNPLLGETFEFQYPEEGWRGIVEKVLDLAAALSTMTCVWLAVVLGHRSHDRHLLGHPCPIWFQATLCIDQGARAASVWAFAPLAVSSCVRTQLYALQASSIAISLHSS